MRPIIDELALWDSIEHLREHGYAVIPEVAHADNYATARGSYRPFFLALAFAASTASGATFLGSPALSGLYGFPILRGHRQRFAPLPRSARISSICLSWRNSGEKFAYSTAYC